MYIFFICSIPNILIFLQLQRVFILVYILRTIIAWLTSHRVKIISLFKVNGGIAFIYTDGSVFPLLYTRNPDSENRHCILYMSTCNCIQIDIVSPLSACCCELLYVYIYICCVGRWSDNTVLEMYSSVIKLKTPRRLCIDGDALLL